MQTPISDQSSEQVRVSVVIPFHGEYCNFKSRCLGSLTRQTFRDFEVIFVQDGPSSHQVQLRKDLEEAGIPFSYLENDRRRGALNSRLRASKVAKGKYIAFLDHDDAYEDNFLDEMFRTAENGDYDVVECAFRLIKGSTTK